MSRLLIAALFLSACGGGDDERIVCTTEAVPAIRIEVLDSATGAPASCGARALITATGYSETVENPDGPSCMNTLPLSGAFERPDTYHVTVSKLGYQEATFGPLSVLANVCHVVTVPLTARLVPL